MGVSEAGFEDRIDLAAELVGGAVIFANDDFFAEKENLLKKSPAIFIDGKYTDRGKWMDGWESRRRRTPGHDYCLVRLGLAGVIHGVVVDTAHFKGNYPKACRIEACAVDGQRTPAELESSDVEWIEILPRVDLQGDHKNRFPVRNSKRFTHLRFSIFPDGGVARLRVHGEVVPPERWLGRRGQRVDLASVENGALVIGANDMFFGSRNNLIMPGRSVNMGDGWETKRSRKEAPDYCVVRLAAEGAIEHVEIDTNHFKGNFPESAALHGTVAAKDASFDELCADEKNWTEILPRTKLQAHTRHHYDELRSSLPFTHVRLRIYPDGGVSRLRLWGVVSGTGRATSILQALNMTSEKEAAALLFPCLASEAWAQSMARARPFTNLEAMKRAAKKAAAALAPKDWRIAFAAHPRIGSKPKGNGAHAAWSKGEQSRVAMEDTTLVAKLAKVNRAYEKKFGHVYLVCATGKSGDELLAIAENRIGQSKASEFERAKEEQLKITDLRLEKLLGGAG